jgi:hypothetical protein
MVEILHLIPGRARLRLEAVKGHPELAQRVLAHLKGVSHINRVSVNTRTGGVLLLYDERALRSSAFLDEVSEALGKLFPGRFGPGRVTIVVPRLKGNPGLARVLEKRLSRVRGIRRVAIDPASGNCLVVYDPKLALSPDFLGAVSDALSAVLPRINLTKLLAFAGLGRR